MSRRTRRRQKVSARRAYSLAILRRLDCAALFVSAALGAPAAAEIAAGINSFLVCALPRGPVCGACDFVFTHHCEVAGFLVLQPLADPAMTVLCGLCPDCTGCDDATLATRVVGGIVKPIHPTGGRA